MIICSRALVRSGSGTLSAAPGVGLLECDVFLDCWAAPECVCLCRGLRHYWGLKVKGQHTKTTGRRGARMAMLAKQAGRK